MCVTEHTNRTADRTITVSHAASVHLLGGCTAAVLLLPHGPSRAAGAFFYEVDWSCPRFCLARRGGRSFSAIHFWSGGARSPMSLLPESRRVQEHRRARCAVVQLSWSHRIIMAGRPTPIASERPADRTAESYRRFDFHPGSVAHQQVHQTSLISSAAGIQSADANDRPTRTRQRMSTYKCGLDRLPLAELRLSLDGLQAT